MRIKVSLLVFPFALAMVYGRLYSVYLFLFCLLSTHEAAHIVTAYCYGYLCEEITVYPFGLVASIPELKTAGFWATMHICLAGPLVHVVTVPILAQCVRYNIISIAYASYLEQLNLNILLFNLLPLYPLDGGRMMNAFFHFLLPYHRADLLSIVFSIFVLLLLCVQGVCTGLAGILLVLFLGIQVYLFVKQHQENMLAFWYNRYRHPLITKWKRNAKNDLYRYQQTRLLQQGTVIEESEWLKRMFDENAGKLQPSVTMYAIIL